MKSRPNRPQFVYVVQYDDPGDSDQNSSVRCVSRGHHIELCDCCTYASLFRATAVFRDGELKSVWSHTMLESGVLAFSYD